MLQKKKQTHQGFTLAEMILVVALTLFLLTVTVQGFVNSASQFTFSNTAEKIQEMIRTARSLAISGRAQQDYSDYNKNKCYDKDNPLNDPGCGAPTAFPNGDLVTPANYGVNFKNNSGTYTVTLFADVHSASAGNEGHFDPGTTTANYEAGKDIVLDSITLPSGMTLILPGNGSKTSTSIFFSPIFADISFEPATLLTDVTTDPFYEFGLSQKLGDILRKRCYQIHKFAGNSEPVPQASITTSETACP